MAQVRQAYAWWVGLLGVVMAVIWLAAAGTVSGTANVGTDTGTLTVEEVAAFPIIPFPPNFNNPVFGILSGGSSPPKERKPNRVFFTSLSGQVFVVEDGVLRPDPFMDVSSLLARNPDPFAFDERGLINIAFHPKFKKNRKFYLRYSAPNGQPDPAHDVVIAEFRCLDPECKYGDLTSGKVIYRLPQTQGMHTGGALFFGRDRMLYASFGHGSALGEPIIHGQNPDEPYSAIIRIDIDEFPYAIPNNNPFDNEVYAYGFRNPFACNVDRKTGKIYCADVGELQREEIDLIKRGGNYGFPILEGSACFPLGAISCVEPDDYVPPVIEYDHSVGTSVQSAVVYRGRMLRALRGIMFVADFGNPIIAQTGLPIFPSPAMPGGFLGFRRHGHDWKRFTFEVFGTGPLEFESPVIVVEDRKGELYFTTVSLLDFQTRIYRVVDATVP